MRYGEIRDLATVPLILQQSYVAVTPIVALGYTVSRARNSSTDSKVDDSCRRNAVMILQRSI